MAERKDAVAEALETLRLKLRDLEYEAKKVREAIGALMATTRASEEGAPAKPKASVRNYSYRFTASCTQCGKEFASARRTSMSPDGYRFCHNPCTASAYRDSLDKATRPTPPTPPPGPTPRDKGTTLVAGARR